MAVETILGKSGSDKKRKGKKMSGLPRGGGTRAIWPGLTLRLATPKDQMKELVEKEVPGTGGTGHQHRSKAKRRKFCKESFRRWGSITDPDAGQKGAKKEEKEIHILEKKRGRGKWLGSQRHRVAKEAH